jgi:hypothetical protein
MFMKEKGVLYVQGRVMSSISNLQFGGVKEGWMGERSTPRTSALGYSGMTVSCVPIYWVLRRPSLKM